FYKLYANLTNREESEFLKKLHSVNAQIKPILEQNNFLQSKGDEDYLALSFTRKSKEVYGNIGFNFHEESSDKTFICYLTISIDKPDKQDFKRIIIAEKISIDELASQAENLIREALNLFKEHKKKYL
ncbi:MAG: hypothetical protein ACXWW0_03605, partial [Bacteroidia bacterium]